MGFLNKKGDFIITIQGLTIIFVGVLAFVMMGAVFYGVGDGTGMFDVAEDTLEVTNHTAYQTVKTTWHWVPLGILISGLLYIIVWSQREQPYYSERRY